MARFRSFLTFLFSIYGFAVFLIMLLLMFPFVVLSSLFGRVRGGNMIYGICRIWADIAFVLWGFRHRNIYESPHDPSRSYVFVFNHISYMDIPILMKAIRGQHIRVLGKAELEKIPIFGFIYRHAAITVDRSNPEARARSVAYMIRYLRKKISVMVAPEGTFNTPGKPLAPFFNGAFRIAIETQTPVKPLLFLDAYDRLNPKSIFSLTPGKSRVVFLEEVPVAGLTLNDMEDLKMKVFRIMEEGLIRYKVPWITESEHGS
jgi:1-acyl-sn-glycerol-3-phosphate acyltransferase